MFPSFPSFFYWLYSSEVKLGNVWNFLIFENIDFCLSNPKRRDLNMTYKWPLEFEFQINKKNPTFLKLLL